MKKITAVWAIVLAIIIVAGAYWYFVMSHQASPSPSDEQQANGISVSGAAGINGAVNQGNLGGVDTGTPQAPQQ